MKKDYNRYCHSLLRIEEVPLFTCICLSLLRTIQHLLDLQRFYLRQTVMIIKKLGWRNIFKENGFLFFLKSNINMDFGMTVHIIVLIFFKITDKGSGQI